MLQLRPHRMYLRAAESTAGARHEGRGGGEGGKQDSDLHDFTIAIVRKCVVCFDNACEEGGPNAT